MMDNDYSENQMTQEYPMRENTNRYDNLMMQDYPMMANTFGYENMMMQDCDNMPKAYDNRMYSTDPVRGHYCNERLVNTIQECEATCEHMTNHLKRLPEYQMRVRQAMLLRDCADICALTAKYIARGAIFAREAASQCASICEECGTECARFPDQMSQNCALVCKHCARECWAFAGM